MNKPPADDLLAGWRRALAREGRSPVFDLGSEGVTSTMSYWADVLYEAPEPSGSFESAGDELSQVVGVDLSWRAGLVGGEREFVERLAAKLQVDVPEGADATAAAPAVDETGPEPASNEQFLEWVPLPPFIKKRVMKAKLRDLHHYIYNVSHSPRSGETYAVRDELRKRFVAQIEAGAARAGSEKHVVVAHSMGTVIAYDCLRSVPECPEIDGLLTLGSPLGLDEVQAGLPGWENRRNAYPAKIRDRWVNVYDRLDPVCGFDPRIANDYERDGQRVIEDVNEQNWGRWRHDSAKYFQGPLLRRALREMVGRVG
ncbi:MAG: alpha/beta hydrolase [Planctomycetes bacterium]|nr:alpha/beta hydrolase [Planctomycetota bacterium]